jgi:hypothetical protein
LWRGNEKEKTSKKHFAGINQQKRRNILMASKRSDEKIAELIKIYSEARESACELNNFESYKIHDEKLFQLYRAKDLKFSYTDEASEWIHW